VSRLRLGQAPRRVRFKAPTIRRLIKMLRLLLSICLVMALSPARAAELQGVSMPDQQDVAGIPLILNGIGLRTYSILCIRIYVAGLYLERPNHDVQATLNSPQVKLLRFTFLRDVDASDPL
jgi:hypothetical protein